MFLIFFQHCHGPVRIIQWRYYVKYKRGDTPSQITTFLHFCQGYGLLTLTHGCVQSHTKAGIMSQIPDEPQVLSLSVAPCPTGSLLTMLHLLNHVTSLKRKPFFFFFFILHKTQALWRQNINQFKYTYCDKGRKRLVLKKFGYIIHLNDCHEFSTC